MPPPRSARPEILRARTARYARPETIFRKLPELLDVNRRLRHRVVGESTGSSLCQTDFSTYVPRSDIFELFTRALKPMWTNFVESVDRKRAETITIANKDSLFGLNICTYSHRSGFFGSVRHRSELLVGKRSCHIFELHHFFRLIVNLPTAFHKMNYALLCVTGCIFRKFSNKIPIVSVSRRNKIY